MASGVFQRGVFQRGVFQPLVFQSLGYQGVFQPGVFQPGVFQAIPAVTPSTGSRRIGYPRMLSLPDPFLEDDEEALLALMLAAEDF